MKNGNNPKTAPKKSFRADLISLRAGELSFDRFAHRHTGSFTAMASHFIARWRPGYLEEADLTQEALLEAWRSVDIWDPDKTADIVRFVEYRVGRKLRVECERVLGWPRKETAKRAGKTAIRPEQFHDEYAAEPPLAAIAVQGAEVIDLFTGLQRDAVAGVVQGAPVKTIAQRIYADQERRTAYDLASLDATIRAVRTAVRTATPTVRRRNATVA